MTFPFAVVPPSGESLVDRTAGTNIGNMTANGGLASAFDGNLSQGQSASATIASTSGYVGKTHSAAKRCSRVVVHGPNDVGYSGGGNGSITIDLYGKTGAAPGSATDGTLIGTITFTDTNNESAGREIISSDQATSYENWWVHVAGAANIAVTELVMYEKT